MNPTSTNDGRTPASFRRALILGATGMIGAHAARACLERGIVVRALIRSPAARASAARRTGFGVSPPAAGGRALLEEIASAVSPSGAAAAPSKTGGDLHAKSAAASRQQVLAFDGGRLEFASGDLADPESLRRALEGCDLAIHAAAAYPRRHFGKKQFLEEAARGMRNFLQASREAARQDLRRVVYVSSSTTIGRAAAEASAPADPVRGPRPATEDDRTRVLDDSPYFAVKFMLEDLAIAAAHDGLPVTIVNPTLCVDEYDDHRTTARLLIPLAQRRLPAYLAGALNAVPTRDVGEGILLAALHGRLGERYILGGENLSTRDFLARCATIARVPPPRVALPLPLAEIISLETELLAWLTGTTPLFPMSGIRMSKWSQPLSSERACRELGYSPTSLDQAIARAYAWYRTRGWLDA
ncbi:MAG: NAD-dependent epimerase/dehydratase family protein [Candidatus Eisenbacteria bacterium]